MKKFFLFLLVLCCGQVSCGAITAFGFLATIGIASASIDPFGFPLIILKGGETIPPLFYMLLACPYCPAKPSLIPTGPA
jgi:hypothetical protein